MKSNVTSQYKKKKLSTKKKLFFYEGFNLLLAAVENIITEDFHILAEQKKNAYIPIFSNLGQSRLQSFGIWFWLSRVTNYHPQVKVS